MTEKAVVQRDGDPGLRRDDKALYKKELVWVCVRVWSKNRFSFSDDVVPSHPNPNTSPLFSPIASVIPAKAGIASQTIKVYIF